MASPRSAPAHFLIKSEPFKYAWDALVRDGRTSWDGVRNFEARNTLRSMRKGDLCLFYHSNEGKEVVGVAKVVREAYADPTAEEGDWSAVDVSPVESLPAPVTLAMLKASPEFASLAIFTRPRLSVIPVTPAHFQRIVALGKRTGTVGPTSAAPRRTKVAAQPTAAAKRARASRTGSRS